MKKIKKTIYIDRYELKRFDYDNNCVIDEISNAEDSNKLKIFYNINNSGLRDFDNFIKADEINLYTIADIEELKEKYNFKNFYILSFYQENGYIGIYKNGSDEALKAKCNNWVNNGSDGFVFLVLYNDENDFLRFENMFFDYVNYVVYYLEVYDNLKNEFVDNSLLSYDDDFLKSVEELKEKYNFNDNDFNI